MLKSMRRHAKYFYALFVVIIISFIFWGVGGMGNGKDKQIVASVGGTKISLNQYWRVYQRAEDSARDTYGAKFDDKMKQALEKQVLGEMVVNEILSHAAHSAGVTVTNDELRAAIASEPAFRQGGAFSRNAYLNVLRMNRITPEEYESSLRQELLTGKMRRLIEDPVVLSPAELASIPKGNDKTAGAIEDALLNMKRQRALESYLEGLRDTIKITENPGLIPGLAS